MLSAALAQPESHALDPLASALLAAELGDPFDLAHAPSSMLRELFEAMPQLRVSVPFAALKLLCRLACDDRTDVRMGVARSLPWLAELYPERVEQLLVPLACDQLKKVRTAAAAALADLIETSTDPYNLIARWERHPERAREVLHLARKSLPPPFGK